MSKFDGSALMFDEEEVRATTAFLPRLIRVIFYGLGITNDSYLSRYFRGYRNLFRDKTRKELSQKCSADRKSLRQADKLTFNLMHGVLTTMDYDILSVSVEVRDNVTGEVRTFSTTDTVEDLKAYQEREKKIGIDSI